MLTEREDIGLRIATASPVGPWAGPPLAILALAVAGLAGPNGVAYTATGLGIVSVLVGGVLLGHPAGPKLALLLMAASVLLAADQRG